MYHASRPSDNDPVDDLDEGDDAEAEKEAKESAKGRDKLNGPHRDASLQFLYESKIISFAKRKYQ